MNKSSRRTVYSSDDGRLCPVCGRPVADCVCGNGCSNGRGNGCGNGFRNGCRNDRSDSPSDGVVRVSRQTKGRKGKGVTLVTGVPLDRTDLAALAKDLKNRCGAGGTVKNGVIEIQGDHRERIVAALQGRGWTVKRSGG